MSVNITKLIRIHCVGDLSIYMFTDEWYIYAYC